MADGGASGKEFTDRVEAALSAAPTDARGAYETVDLMTPYLAALKARVDAEAIRNAGLRVVVDPLYGAGRRYLAGLLRDLGVEVCEINNGADPTFDGLHPEPIPPWVDRCIAKVPELGFDAGFINDGDADRIGAVDEHGNFVNPHRIITLIVSHLAEDKGLSGRVVSTITASAMLARQCKRLGLELVSTPVGFKWIYAEMEKGGVMVGGEESGGIGIPGHVMERDGLLMALLLCETMAQRGMSLGQLVDDMFSKVGRLEFERQGLSITEEQMGALPRRGGARLRACGGLRKEGGGRGPSRRREVLPGRRRVAHDAPFRHRGRSCASTPRLRRQTRCAPCSRRPSALSWRKAHKKHLVEGECFT